ncbi:hypothetical protein BpHYR1_036720 [Brachionus plicatilis]|uniref:Uncharacterized protein n=1 Tax=Brachionus plicatilis TaxID=10195 RepID=A0A3M7RL35_BRAPC|nr:hypothetical protein BpHYR1_036720 [Brachionus plicatilis]
MTRPMFQVPKPRKNASKKDDFEKKNSNLIPDNRKKLIVKGDGVHFLFLKHLEYTHVKAVTAGTLA